MERSLFYFPSFVQPVISPFPSTASPLSFQKCADWLPTALKLPAILFNSIWNLPPTLPFLHFLTGFPRRTGVEKDSSCIWMQQTGTSELIKNSAAAPTIYFEGLNIPTSTPLPKLLLVQSPLTFYLTKAELDWGKKPHAQWCQNVFLWLPTSRWCQEIS